MKYLCLIYYDERKLNALTKHDYDSLVEDALVYDEVLRRAGYYIASDALASVSCAATLRPEDGKVAITDGPFAETKEQLGGFILIEAEDLEEAVRIASKIPPARLGCVEVRPIKELCHPSFPLV